MSSTTREPEVEATPAKSTRRRRGQQSTEETPVEPKIEATVEAVSPWPRRIRNAKRVAIAAVSIGALSVVHAWGIEKGTKDTTAELNAANQALRLEKAMGGLDGICSVPGKTSKGTYATLSTAGGRDNGDDTYSFGQAGQKGTKTKVPAARVVFRNANGEQISLALSLPDNGERTSDSKSRTTIPDGAESADIQSGTVSFTDGKAGNFDIGCSQTLSLGLN